VCLLLNGVFLPICGSLIGRESQYSCSPRLLLDRISSLLGLPMYKYLSSLLLGVVGSQMKVLLGGTGLLKAKHI
jgi:hypothetical protein